MEEKSVELTVTYTNCSKTEDFVEDLERGESVVEKEAQQQSPTQSSVDEREQKSSDTDFCSYIQHTALLYARKWVGVEGKTKPKMNTFQHMIISGILGFVGVFLIAVTDFWYLSGYSDGVVMLSGAYAATAGKYLSPLLQFFLTILLVLVYDAHQSPLAQPRNVLGGYLFSSFIGVTTRIICGYIGIPSWVTGGLAVGFAIIGMNLTQTTHPPGGACALISVIGGNTVINMGYGYMLTSIGGAFIMVSVAIVGNNLAPERQYPLYWW